jgi:acetyltransferase-like isoleucine patch superfamily enzyme
VTIYQSSGGGPVEVGDNVRIYRDTIIQTGQGGSVKLAPNLVVQPRCQFSAYKGSIEIRSDAQIAPNCAFYPYNHGFSAGELIYKQPLSSKGGIIIGEDAWLGFGVIILDGVTIGKGAIIGAGSVVTKSIPDGSVAAGNPAKIIGTRRQNGIEKCTV